MTSDCCQAKFACKYGLWPQLGHKAVKNGQILYFWQIYDPWVNAKNMNTKSRAYLLIAYIFLICHENCNHNYTTNYILSTFDLFDSTKDILWKQFLYCVNAHFYGLLHIHPDHWGSAKPRLQIAPDNLFTTREQKYRTLDIQTGNSYIWKKIF